MRFKNTSKVIIFSFIYLSIISPALLRPMALAAEDAQAYNNQATKSADQEPARPYQNPPQAKPEIYYSMPPKTIDKGDYYLSEGKKINLLRLKDQVAIRGEEKEIDQVVRDWGSLKSRKVKYQNKIHKNTFIYQLEESGEEDFATEMSEDLKTESKIHFSSPVFYDNQSGLRMVLTDELVVKLKEGYTQDDLLAINPPYIQIKKTLSFTTDEFILIITEPKKTIAQKLLNGILTRK